MKSKLSRRDFLKLGGAGIITAAGATAALAQTNTSSKTDHKSHLLQPPLQMDHGEGLPGVDDWFRASSSRRGRTTGEFQAPLCVPQKAITFASP
jgi:hypothetical protein